MRAALLALLLTSCAGTCGQIGHGSIGTAAIGNGAVGSGAVGGLHGVADLCDIAAATGVTPVLHYAARLETAYANNDPVTSLNDWGSQGDDVSQGTGAAQPTFKSSGPGGRAYISLDGGDFLESTSSLTLNLTQAWFCAVYNTGAALGSTQPVLADDAAASRTPISETTGNNLRSVMGTQQLVAGTATNTWLLGCLELNAAASDELWLNGALGTTAEVGANDFDRARIGTNSTSTAWWTGAVAELMVFTADPNFDTVEAELESTACYGNDFPFAGTP